MGCCWGKPKDAYSFESGHLNRRPSEIPTRVDGEKSTDSQHGQTKKTRAETKTEQAKTVSDIATAEPASKPRNTGKGDENQNLNMGVSGKDETPSDATEGNIVSIELSDSPKTDHIPISTTVVPIKAKKGPDPETGEQAVKRTVENTTSASESLERGERALVGKQNNGKESKETAKKETSESSRVNLNTSNTTLVEGTQNDKRSENASSSESVASVKTEDISVGIVRDKDKTGPGTTMINMDKKQTPEEPAANSTTDVDIPEPDYEDDRQTRPLGRSKTLNSAPNSRKSLHSPLGDDNKALQELHRELAMNQKMGIDVLHRKTEMQKELERRKTREIQKENSKNKNTMEQALQETAIKLKQTGRKDSIKEVTTTTTATSNTEIPNGESEFARVHSKIYRTKVTT